MAITQANLTQGSALTVTNNVVTGTGVFDDLMEAVTTHLEAQYQLGRITGGDFATVYLGAMQAAISQSVSFTLGQESTNAAVILQTKQGLKVDKDALLVVAQELLTDAQKTKVDADVVLAGKQGALTDAQKLKVDADELLVDKQVVKLTSDIALDVKQGLLVDSQKLKVNADKLLTDSQKLKVDADELLVDKQVVKLAADIVLLGKQGSKIDADKLLVDAQELRTDKEVVKITADIALGVKQGALVDAQELKVDADKLLVDAQKLKTDGEKALLLQKQVTEFAQTRVTGNNTPHADSIMGKQSTLYGEQSKGFKWNADQKYLKTLLDAWAININVAGTASTGVVALNATGTGNINTQISNAEPVEP